MKNSNSLWVVSSLAATTAYGSSETSNSSLVFKEEISLDKLRSLISDFTSSLSSVLDSVEKAGTQFKVDSIEISAVMAADGKLGILGSGIGTKAEGSIKFVFKRKSRRHARKPTNA